MTTMGRTVQLVTSSAMVEPCSAIYVAYSVFLAFSLVRERCMQGDICSRASSNNRLCCLRQIQSLVVSVGANCECAYPRLFVFFSTVSQLFVASRGKPWVRNGG